MKRYQSVCKRKAVDEPRMFRRSFYCSLDVSMKFRPNTKRNSSILSFSRFGVDYSVYLIHKMTLRERSLLKLYFYLIPLVTLHFDILDISVEQIF